MVQDKNYKSMMLAREDGTENIATFAVLSGERSKPTVTEKGSCTHHGKYDHEESNCYELIGYPPDWGAQGSRSRGRGRGASRGHSGRGRGVGRESAHAATVIDS